MPRKKKQPKARKVRVISGIAWFWLDSNKTGGLRGRWSCTTGQTVDIFPPDEDNATWTLCVDSITVLDLPRTTPEVILFAAGEAFLRSEETLKQILADQRYIRRRHEHTGSA